jgi:hypothetical protein
MKAGCRGERMDADPPEGWRLFHFVASVASAPADKQFSVCSSYNFEFFISNFQLGFCSNLECVLGFQPQCNCAKSQFNVMLQRDFLPSQLRETLLVKNTKRRAEVVVQLCEFLASPDEGFRRRIPCLHFVLTSTFYGSKEFQCSMLEISCSLFLVCIFDSLRHWTFGVRHSIFNWGLASNRKGHP